MGLNGMERLRGKIRVPSVEHQNRVKRGGVQSGRCASPKNHGPSCAIIPHADIRRQGDLDEDGCIGQHAVDSVTLPIVASVEQKQGVGWVPPIPPLGVLGETVPVRELWHDRQVRPFPSNVSVVNRRLFFSLKSELLCWVCELENAAASTRIVIVAFIAF